MNDAPRPRGRPRKHPLPPMPAPAAEPSEPRCTGRVRWKGSSGAHPRGALQIAWQCAGGIEWRPLEVVGPDAPDTEDAH